MNKTIAKLGVALVAAGGLALTACIPPDPPPPTTSTTTTSTTSTTSSTTSTTVPQLVNDYAPRPIPVTQGDTVKQLQVGWDFGGANTAVFVDICKKLTSDPTFNLTEDCDRGGLKAFNGSSDGTGSATTQIAVGPTFGWQIFGQNLDKWGCYPPGFPVDAGFDAPANCYLRVTQTARNNNDDAFDIPVEWAVS